MRTGKWSISSDWTIHENADVEGFQIFALFLLFISKLNIRLLQMRRGSQSILLEMPQGQTFLPVVKLEMFG